MSRDTPRSSAGLTTPRSFDEIIDSWDPFPAFHGFDKDKCTNDEDKPPSHSGSERECDNLKIISKLINVCSNCDRCEKKTISKLSDLETRFTEELLARHRQMYHYMQLMIGYEKKTREWFSEKNAIIEKLQFEKSSTDIEKFALTEKLVNVSNQLINLQKLYNDNQRKYERANDTIKILNCNVDTLKISLQEYEEYIKQKETQFEQLKEHAVERLNQANAQLDLAEKNFLSESSKLRESMTDRENKLQELTEQIEQKNQENTELISICQFLLQSLKEPKNRALDELIYSSATMWLNDITNSI